MYAESVAYPPVDPVSVMLPSGAVPGPPDHSVDPP